MKTSVRLLNKKGRRRLKGGGLLILRVMRGGSSVIPKKLAFGRGWAIQKNLATDRRPDPKGKICILAKIKAARTSTIAIRIGGGCIDR